MNAFRGSINILLETFTVWSFEGIEAILIHIDPLTYKYDVNFEIFLTAIFIKRHFMIPNILNPNSFFLFAIFLL